MTAAPQTIVVAGGGVAGLELVLALDELAGPDVRITLLEPEDVYVEQAMTIAEVFEHGERARRPLAAILQGTRVALVHEALALVDPSRHVLRTASGAMIGYDRLVIAIGAAAVAFAPGVLSVEPRSVEGLRALAAEVADGTATHVGIVIPPGRHWSLPAYELALKLADHGAAVGRRPEITVVAPEPRPLSIFGEDAARTLAQRLEADGIAVLPRASAEVLPGPPPVVIVHPGRRTLTVDRVAALPRLRPRRIAGVGFPADGFLRVDAVGRVNGTPDVYAVGDATDGPVKLGSLAAQQAEATARHLAAPPEPGAGAAAPTRAVPRATLHGAPHVVPLPLPLGREPDPDAALKVAAPRLAARLSALSAPPPS
ncbi:hypothetical protein FSW04_21190 [Baekduia soli]|uniref:FAD/NAD(P)-binding domain-containing protein n=1 Tax=Baekduia soli TaxID=496014 RepID=A0A5B8UB08_9ACTN|nr:FAD-dependent oxidoreductase [Baekduia soli]QEC49832.1 hypothetical protein FSW04_21190 [Baekduia soli]